MAGDDHPEPALAASGAGRSASRLGKERRIGLPLVLQQVLRKPDVEGWAPAEGVGVGEVVPGIDAAGVAARVHRHAQARTRRSGDRKRHHDHERCHGRARASYVLLLRSARASRTRHSFPVLQSKAGDVRKRRSRFAKNTPPPYATNVPRSSHPVPGGVGVRAIGLGWRLMEFCALAGEYVVLRLPLSRFQPQTGRFPLTTKSGARR